MDHGDCNDVDTASNMTFNGTVGTSFEEYCTGLRIQMAVTLSFLTGIIMVGNYDV